MSTSAGYLDLYINLEDVPDHHLQNITPTTLSDPYQFAASFLKKLQQLLLTSNKQELFLLYEVDFHYAQQKLFHDIPWPEPHVIQQKFDIQVNFTTQSIYNELIYRSLFERLKNEQPILELAVKSWDNYLSIFQNITSKLKMNLPAGWIWDIIDEFIFQFYAVCRWKSTAQKQKVEQLDPSNWNVQKIQQIFRELYQNLVQNNKLILIEEASFKDLFGYYSLIGHFRIKVLSGKFQEALNLISIVSLEHTLLFSKAFGSQLSLFYFASFCYFMEQKYLEAAKLAETIAIFYDKYKKFISKSMTQKTLSKINDKILGLWCISHVFEGNEPNEYIIELLKETSIKTKQRNYKEKLFDKLEKLKQFDESTLIELFNYSAPKLINQNTLQVEEHKNILIKFQNLKKISFNTILKYYERIQLQKAAKFLKITQKELLEKIQKHGRRKIELQQDKIWEKTILKPILKIEVGDKVIVQDGIILIQKEGQRRQIKNYSNLIVSINDLAKKLERL